MNVPKIILALMISLALLSLAACRAEPSPGSDLMGQEWTLVSMGPVGQEQPAISGGSVTLKFDAEGQASGSGGCNSYGGKYEIGEGDKITFSDVVSTLMACADTAMMDQESQYFNALQTAESFQVNGDTLVIVYDGGQMTLNRAAGQ